MSTNQSPSISEETNSIVSLRSAFSLCDPGLLLDVLLDIEVGWGITYRDIGLNAKESLLEKLISTLALMRSVDDRAQCINGKKFEHSSEDGFIDAFGSVSKITKSKIDSESCRVIIPCETFEVSNDGRSFVRQLDAKLLDCSKLKDAMKVIQQFGGRRSLSSNCISTLRSLDGASPFELASEIGLLEDIDVLEEEPWYVALQRKIWLPHAFCERERYCVLANVFWAITYNGFFGNAAEKILGKQEIERSEEFGIQDFDIEYEARMFEIASLLNYNSWVDSIESLLFLCDAA